MALAACLDEIVDALSEPEAYPHHPASVDTIETHGSHIFLAGEYAYKMKKAVRYPFFDFSTLEKRRVAIERELRLNRRLAPGIYLGIRPVWRDEGRIRVGEADGVAEPIEYLLEMRALPDERFLPHLLAEGELSTEALKRIARRIARFHLGAARGDGVAAHGRPKALRRMFFENLDECGDLPPELRPDENLLADCRAAYERLLRQLEPVFDRRAEEGFVRDIHGDLRMEHIVLLDDDVIIFDCLDFRDDFRCMDTAHEMASLLMELRYAGFANEAKTLLLAYLDETGDDALLPLLSVYQLHRALVRGKVEALKAGAETLAPAARRRAAMMSFDEFQLAGGIASREMYPRLVVLSGLIASGKSTLARGLGQASGASVHHSDEVRKQIANRDPASKNPDAWGEGLYSAEMSERVYAALHGRAREDLASGRDAVLDASFSRRADREAFSRLAHEFDARLWLIESVCSDEERRRRLEKRVELGASISDGRVEIMDQQAAAFAPYDGEERIVISTEGSKADSLRRALRALYLG